MAIIGVYGISHFQTHSQTLFGEEGHDLGCWRFLRTICEEQDKANLMTNPPRWLETQSPTFTSYTYKPIGSMVLLYMVTWIPSIYPQC